MFSSVLMLRGMLPVPSILPSMDAVKNPLEPLLFICNVVLLLTLKSVFIDKVGAPLARVSDPKWKIVMGAKPLVVSKPDP